MISVSASLFQRNQSSSLFEQFLQPKIAGADQQKSDQLAHHTLNKALKESVGVELPRPIAPTAEAFDVESVVNSVMDHITQRIDQAAADGASDEELESMINAAREGVETGFAQAKDQLEELGRLNESLISKIDEAENGIYGGIDELEESLFASEDAGENVDTQMPSHVFESESAFYSKQNSFSFEVTTQEGDKVSISAFNKYAEQSSSLFAAGPNGEMSMESFSSIESSGYSLMVQGDLNDEEMTALEALFAQVNDVADSFYEGDVETAFNMALELGYDGEQIAQFSLNLKQTEVQAYQYAGYQAYGADQALPRGISSPLSDFADGLAQAADKASLFQNPFDLVKTMLEELDSNPKMHSLAEPLLDSMGA